MGRNFSGTNHDTIYNAGDTSWALDWAGTQVVLPKNWKGDGTVPLIIYCHGAGEDALLPMDASRNGQQGNITALAEAGWPVLLGDFGGKETWARQSAPSGRQSNNAGPVSGTSITIALTKPAQPRSLLRLSIAYSQTLVPATPTVSGGGWSLVSSANNTGNYYLYVFDKVATGGELSFNVTGIPSGSTKVGAIIEEFAGWAGTPTRDFLQSAVAIGATNLNDIHAFTPVLPSELATGSAIFGGAITMGQCLWGSTTQPPGITEASNYPINDLATVGAFGVGAVSGNGGSVMNWTTARNAALIDVSYYDKVTAPDFTNAWTVIDYINDAITWAASTIGAKTSKIGMFGTSMGGLNSLYFTAHNLAKVKAWAGVGPVNDLNDIVANNRGGFAATVNGCYPGGYSDATYGATHNPTVMAGAGAYGSLPMQIWYGASDAIVVPATVTNFASLVGASCSINSMAGGHAESTWAEVDTDALVAHFLTNLGLS